MAVASLRRKLSLFSISSSLRFFGSFHRRHLCSHSDGAGGVCPGCGVSMQSADPALPGFFSPPSPKSDLYNAPLRSLSLDSDLSLSLKTSSFALPVVADDQPPPQRPSPILVCARCHSLRHYGRVKNLEAERLLHEVDFVLSLGHRIASASGARSLLLLLADAADFDGSFPRAAARIVASAAAAHEDAHTRGSPANYPRALLVLTKLDLLPAAAVSPGAVDAFVRARANAAVVNTPLRLAGVHLVSATRNWGIRELVDHASELAGTRGNVWAVGARNVGKSTLLNAMARSAGALDGGRLTEAPVPGTTVGVLRVDGVLNGQAKLFDTPGLIHPHQMSSRLTPEEQRLIHINKELRPRTYRVMAGHTIHIGGLMRLDVDDISLGSSIYVTVWASPLVPLHMGKTENASDLFETHFGSQLQPPIGVSRVNELGRWARREFRVSGNSWTASSVDIAGAGIGWFAVALKGDAVLGVWTYEGIDVVLRGSLMPNRASIFEEAGFTVSKIVAKADSELNRQKRGRRKSESPLSQSLEADSVKMSA